jgi:hypothetical protein
MLNHQYFAEDDGKSAPGNGAPTITAEEVSKLREQVDNLNKAVSGLRGEKKGLESIIQQNQEVINQANSIVTAIETIKADPSIKNLAWLTGKSEDEFKKILGVAKSTDSDLQLSEGDIPPKLLQLIDTKMAQLQNEVTAAKKEIETQKSEFQKASDARQAQDFANEVERIRQTSFLDLDAEDWQEIYPTLLLKVSKYGFKDGATKTREWVDKFAKKGHALITTKEKEIAEKNLLELTQKGLPISEIPSGGFKSFEEAEEAFDKTTERSRQLFEK